MRAITDMTPKKMKQFDIPMDFLRSGYVFRTTKEMNMPTATVSPEAGPLTLCGKSSENMKKGRV